MIMVNILSKKGADAGGGKEGRAWYNSKTGIMTLSILLSLAFSFAIYFFYIGPQFDRVGPGKEFDVAALDQKVGEQEQILEQLKTLRQNFEAIDQEQVDLLSRMLPHSKDVPELLAQLEAIARQSGVDLITVNIAEVKDTTSQTARQRLQAQAGQAAATPRSNQIKEMTIQLEIGAYRYDTYRAFLLALQTHVRLLDVERYTFSTENDTHSLTLRTYYLDGAMN
jgi:hypothetical protein